MLREKLERQRHLISYLKSDHFSAQEAHILLRHSIVISQSYSERTVAPDLLRPSATEFDHLVRDCSLLKNGLTRESLEWNPERKAVEFTKMELPFRLQGLGLRSSEFTSPLAYYSSLANATICDREVSRASIPTIADAPAKLVRDIAHATEIIRTRCQPTADSSSEPPSISTSAPPPVSSSSSSPPPDTSTHDPTIQSWDHYPIPSCPPFKMELIPSPEQFFQHFHSTPSVTPYRGLQRQLSTSALYKRSIAILRTAVRNKDVHTLARIESLRQPHAGRWLCITPSDPRLRLSDQYWAVNIRLFLGLQPTTRPLPPPVSSCFHGSRFLCNEDLTKDPLHFLNCTALKRTSGLTGHDTINKIILESCRDLYQRCVWQPLHLAGSRAGEQPDLYIEFIQNSIRKVIADVVVTNCQAASYCNRAVWNCKAVLADRERLKEFKYAHLAVPNQAEIIGLAFDALGGMGPHAEELINYICELSQESPLLLSPRNFASLIRDRISIALARRAGALIQEGENRIRYVTSTMLTARPSPSTPSTPSPTHDHTRTQTTPVRIRRLPKGMRWTPRRRQNEGESEINVHVCGGLSESEEE
jgi:hypothetical protein